MIVQVYRNRHYMNSKNIPPDHDDDEDALWKSAFDRLPDESVDDFCDQLSTKSEQCSEHLGVYYPAYYAGLCESISGDSDIQYADPSLSIQALKKIFKHPFNPDQTLDLHHLRGHEAYPSCQLFLMESFRQGHRQCRLVCGKGHHSAGQSLLKGICVFILERTPFVLAYQSSHRQRGSTGSIDVYLKKYSTP